MGETSYTNRRRRGQTLAEFSLTLPILLILTFGTIEFGRVFQAWVTVQNAAREATRYATTGQYDEDKYDIDTVIKCDQNDTRGTLHRGNRMNSGSPEVDFYAGGNAVTGFVPTGESLFATWYGGQNCESTDEMLGMRKDILRIMSIKDVGRRGAAGLSLENSEIHGNADSVWKMMTDLWTIPAPRSDLPGYFNVSICSSRGFLDPTADTIDPNDLKIPKTRFFTILDDTQIPDIADFGYSTPYCMLNEKPTGDALNNKEITHNWGLQWLDPGGPGDRVSVFVTFNHPLITPLGLAEYITMTARRSGVNESFRASRALGAVQGSPSGGGVGETNTPPPASATPTATDSPTPTSSASPTFTHTPTNTPEPFDCANLHVGNLSFFQQRVFFQITNFNAQDTTVEKIHLKWVTPGGFSGMFLSSMAINSGILWVGEQNTPPELDTSSLTGADLTRFNGADKRIRAFETSIWEGAFLGAGFNIATVMNPWDFTGSEFTFTNIDNPSSPCRVIVDVPPPPDPSDLPTIPPDATATYTPNCASSSIEVSWAGFESFGVVKLLVDNRRHQSAPLTDFRIVWPDPAGLNPSQVNVLTLRRITVEGANPDDNASIEIWRGKEDWGDGGSKGDRTPDTTPGEPGTSFWRNSYSFPPRSITPVYLDFEGTPGKLDQAFNITTDMFNGTRFTLTCTGGDGGSGGGGSVDDGDIILSTLPPPLPTNTRPPTRTPGPTKTPSPTRPSPTPSNTHTPGPTFTPSNTATITNTPPPALPTSVDQGDGSGGETGN